jgi:hypothetical protein
MQSPGEGDELGVATEAASALEARGRTTVGQAVGQRVACPTVA